MRINIVLGLLALVILYPGAGMGQELIANPIHAYNGTGSFVIENNLMYFCVGDIDGIYVADLQDYNNITELGWIDCDDWMTYWNVKYLKYNDGVLLVGCNAGQSSYLKVLNVIDAQNIYIEEELNFNCGMEDMAIDGDFAYIIDYNGLHIYDISDPSNIQLEGEYEPIGNVDYQAIIVTDSLVWIIKSTLNNARVLCFNIADPNTPELVSTISSTTQMNDIAYSNNHIFVTNFNNSDLYAIDYTIPTQPLITDSLDFSYYGSNLCKDIYIDGNLLYAAKNGELYLTDISNPDNIIIKSGTGVEKYGAIGVMGDIVITGDGFGYSIVEVDSSWGGWYDMNYLCDFDNRSIPENISAPQNGILYVADCYQGLRVFDVDDNLNIFEYNGYYPGDWCFTQLYVQDDLLFLYNYYYDIMHLVDISDPVNPEFLSEIDSIVYHDLAVHNNVLYITNSYSMAMYDISDTSNPISHGLFTANHPDFIENRGSFLYITSSYQDQKGLRVYDITNPYSPNQVAYLNLNVRYEMVINGDYCYITGYDDSLVLYSISISQPSNPVITDTTIIGPIISEYTDLCVVGDNLIASIGNTMKIFKTYNPGHPVNTINFTVPGNQINSISSDGSYVYVIVDDRRLYVYDCSEALPIEKSISELYPSNYDLLSCYPNPFNSSTTISFTLEKAGEVELKVYDIGGREVQRLEAGSWRLGKNSVVWDAGGCGSGVYFIRLTVDGGQSSVKKVVLMK